MKKTLPSPLGEKTSAKRWLFFLLVNFLAIGSLSAQENLNISLAGPVTADPGDLITYTITYYNSGVTPAQNVVITHQLPLLDQFTYVSSTPAGVVSGNTITWTSAEIPALASLGSGAQSITVNVRAGTPGDGVTGALEGYYMPGPTNNLVSFAQIQSNVTTTPVLSNSLTTLVTQYCGAQMNDVNAVVKSASNSNVVGLLQIINTGNIYDSYDLSHTNQQCPGGEPFDPLTLNFVDIDGNPVSTTGWLAPGEGFIVFLQITAPNGSNPGKYSCHTLTALSTLCNTPFQSLMRTYIDGAPKEPLIYLTKLDSKDPVQSGDTLIYTIFAYNSNDDYIANNFQITDIFPSNITIIGTSYYQEISTFVSSTENSWTFSELPEGMEYAIYITIEAIVNDNADFCTGEIHNVVNATYTYGPQNTDGSASTQSFTTIQNYPDLLVTKTGISDPFPAEPGGTITYTISYENIGTCVATNVELTDVYDNLYTENPIFVSGPSGNISGNNITWNIGTLVPGASGSVSYTVDILGLSAFMPGTTPIINLASISGFETELNLENNTSSHIEYVYNLPDLSISKTVSPDPIQVGSNATYTLTISNTGDIAATGVMVKDFLPDNLTFVSASDGGTLNVDGDVEWPALASLAPGGSFTQTITVTPTCAAIGSVTNMAEVYSDQNDANEADNTYELISQVVDLVPPVISQCPAGYTLEGCSVGDITGLVYSETPVSLTLQEWTDAGGVASDNCGVTEWGYVDSSDGQCPIVVTRTWTVKDASGNATTCTQTINIDDTIAPTWTTSAGDLDVTVECSDAAALTAAQALFPVASDNCDADVSNIDKVSGSFVAGSECSQAGTYTNTWTVTDECGNTSATYTQVITVVDTTAPVISTQAQDQTVECDGTGNTADLNAWLASNGGAVAADACGDITWSNNFTALSDGCGATGSVTVTFRATDDCGLFSETTATFTIVDTTNPVFTTIPENLTVECDGSGNTTQLNNWLADVAASDGCGSVTITNDFIALSDLCGATGSATVNWTAEDDCGNTTTTSATFTIVDTTDPVFTTIPVDLTVECDGSGNTTQLNNWLADVAASDGCGSVTITNDFTALSDLCGATGSATVTWTAEDDCGNTTTTSATFTIEDTTDPLFTTIPENLTVECDGAGNTTDLNDWLANVAANDGCGSVTITNDFEALSDLCGATGSATVTWTAEDDCGNTTTTSATFTIEDTTSPVFTTIPVDLTVECDGSGNTTQLNNWLTNVAATDGCGSVTITNDFEALSDLCGATGSATVTWTAEDDCGNTTTTSATFTIADTQAPFINTTLLTDLTLECDGTSDPDGEIAAWLIANGGATAGDNCGTVTWSHDFEALSDGCGATGTALVTFTATDDCGLSSTVSANVTIEDTTPPAFTCPDNIIVTADPGQDYASVVIPVPVVIESCGTVTLVNDFTLTDNASGQYPLGTTTVVYTATDECGLVTTCSFTVTVNDDEPPVISCPPAITVNCISQVPEPYANYAAFVAAGGSATDNDAINESSFTMVSETSDGLSCPETITRVYQIADVDGNVSVCSQSIVVDDQVDPVFTTIPENLTVECDGEGNASELNVWLANVAATDNCGEVTITNDFTALSDLCGATGSATVIWTAEDDCGNATTTSATFTIVDTTDPVFTIIPADLTVECDGAGNTAQLNDWLADVAATDGCGNVTISNNFTTLSDDCGATGSAMVTWTAEDDCGNTTTTSATFTIVDTTAPVFTIIPADLTLECDGTGNTTQLNDWLTDVAAIDGCGSVTISNNFTALSDECGATGSATVTWTAEDDCGNTTTTSATFTIVDTTDPVFTTIPENLTVECDGAGNATELNDWLANVAATDGCGAVTITNDFTALSDECGATGSATVTWTAEDDCGNTTTTSATFTIVDTTDPVFTTIPDNLTVECDGAGNTAQLNDWLVNVAATDGCGTVTITNDFTGLSDLCGVTGSATVTWTAEDDCGNTTTTSATFTIEDTTDPLFTVVPDDLTVECDGAGNTAQLNAWLADVAATDGCGSVTISNNFTALSDECGATGSATVTWTAEDDCGNTATTSATFTIEDTTPPAFFCPDDIIVTADPGQDFATIVIPIPVVSETCGTVVLENDYTLTDNASGQYPLGITTITYTATDECGLVTTCSFTITVNDDEPPVISCPPAITVNCIFEVPEPYADYAAFVAAGGLASDNSAIDESSFMLLSETSDDLSCPETITRVYQIADDGGNLSSCSQIIIVDDQVAPLFTTIPEDLTVECDGEGNTAELNVWLADVAATDNCGDVILTHDFEGLTDGCGATGNATVTWTATDDCGNTATISATFSIEDTTAPTITCPDSPIVVVIGADETGYVAEGGEFDHLGIDDICGEVTATHNLEHSSETTLDGYEFPLGDTEVIWTVTDDCGNTTECSFIVTVYAPSLLVTKTADPQTYSNVGEEINYTITVTNNGNATLTDVVVTDPLTGLDFTIETLLPGETATFNETYIITYDDLFNGSVENTALASGFDPEDNEVTQSDTEIIYVVLDELQITLVSQTNVLCFGDETGAAEVQVAGGLYPYTIIWYTDPEQTGTTATNLPAGTYVVIVTDALGNTATITVIITQPEAPLNITYQVTNVLCNGAATGAVDVQVFGGTPPYSFNWSNGATTQNISELFAGTYSAIIEDANGCLLDLEVEITEPDALYISDIVIEGVLCMVDEEGSIQFSVGGGVTPYTYLWSNGATTAGLVNVPGGDYWVEVTDANGCLLSYDFFVPYQEEDCELRFPQGVSPDGDGFNDTWVINGLIRFPNNNLRIFNRWGTIVFEAAPYQNDWDGRPNRGRPADGPDGILPTGTYFYVIELEPGMNIHSGYIYLVK
ncbi:MAG: HYR domain-containing protein [Bacteroides sp.]|jgi:uncharacterized repeat protein (TIGR01451 family)/gliding motility-associated-like protein|nr:HYR domain-containing protein [Bacteroides sp.]